MSTEIIHAIVVIFTIGLAFLFSKSSLQQFDLQTIALLFVILYVSKKFFKHHLPSYFLETVIFSFIITVMVITTGGLLSPVFFLLYFLLFAWSLLLEPVIAITSSLAIIIFFLVFSSSSVEPAAFIPLISLVILTPFALLVGKEYTEVQKSKLQAEKLQKDNKLFLALVLKNHVKNILTSVDNFMGDHELHEIKAQATRMEKLIDDYEKDN